MDPNHNPNPIQIHMEFGYQNQIHVKSMKSIKSMDLMVCFGLWRIQIRPKSMGFEFVNPNPFKIHELWIYGLKIHEIHNP